LKSLHSLIKSKRKSIFFDFLYFLAGILLLYVEYISKIYILERSGKKVNEDLSRVRQKISRLRKKREVLETKILNTGNLLKASYYERFITCGKQNCKCKQGEKHGPIPWVTGYKGKKTVSTSVPIENVARVKKMTQNYKDFRNAQKEIEDINKEINKLIQKILQMKEYDIGEFTRKEGDKNDRK
jgi:hypothetical protein